MDRPWCHWLAVPCKSVGLEDEERYGDAYEVACSVNERGHVDIESPDEFLARRERELELMAESLFSGIPGPKAGWRLNAALYVSWEDYAFGYKSVADRLVATFMNQGHFGDSDAYPVVFLYRHYLELRLKQLLVASGLLLDEEAKAPNTHKLVPLWTMLRPRLEHFYSDDRSMAFYDDIGTRLEEFDSVDAGSYAFRYPVDRQAVPNLQGLNQINIKRVSDVVGAMAQILDGASDAFDRWQNTKNDLTNY